MKTTFVEIHTVSCCAAKTLWHKYMKLGIYYNFFPTKDCLVEEPDWDENCDYQVTVETVQAGGVGDDIFYLWNVEKVEYENEFSVEGLKISY